MRNTEWTATDWGVQTENEYGLPIERCAEIRKERYLAIEDVSRRFLGEEHDIEFIRAWREAMGRHALAIDEDSFKCTIRSVTAMSAHFFVYRISENMLFPPRFSENDDVDEIVDRYHSRTSNQHSPQIEELTSKTLKTTSRTYY